MTACLLSQGVLATCLVLAEGDLDVSLEDIASRAEEYQKMANRHFGVFHTDFRWLLRWLTAYDLRTESFGSEMEAIRLRDVANERLALHGAYSNDTGEYWCDATQEDVTYLDNEVRSSSFYWDLDDVQWNTKLRPRDELQSLFDARTDTKFDLGQARGLMARLNVTEIILKIFSRPGSAS